MGHPLEFEFHMMANGRPSRVYPRFVMLGGFLGSGKTTALLRLARRYVANGLRVAIITNDQGDGLVDTETFRTQGFVTEEIPSGCFCCKFDELVAAAGRLADGHKPDVLLAEPVGSCTDLVATVINPLRKLYADRFSVAPYVVLLDPERAQAALSPGGPGGFSAKVTYIFKMQQNEADVVAINKIDTITSERLDELTGLVQRNFPKAEVIAVSARTGEGFDRLAVLLEAGGPVGAHPANVDYDEYAEGEAQLGWLNATLKITAPDGFDADTLVLELAGALGQAMAELGAEPAHIKIILRSGEQAAIANLVGSARPPELTRSIAGRPPDRESLVGPSGESRRAGAQGSRLTEGELIVNARVEADPAVLRDQFERVVRSLSLLDQVGVTIVSLEAFAPERPVPTHHISELDGE